MRSVLSSQNTICPKRANAGSNIGKLSLCLSIPSKINTKWPLSFNNFCRCTAKVVAFSQRLTTPSSLSCVASSPTEVAQAAKVDSSRCLVVMHSRTRTRACGTSIASSDALTMLLLPVASGPCMTHIGGLPSTGYT